MALWVLLQVTCIATFRIPSDSMEPALLPGDNICHYGRGGKRNGYRNGINNIHLCGRNADCVADDNISGAERELLHTVNQEINSYAAERISKYFLKRLYLPGIGRFQ